MLRLLTVLVMMLAVLAVPAHAQRRGSPAQQGPSPEDMDKKRQEQALDQQYQSTLKRMNADGTPVRVDPWANVRGSDNGKR